MPQPTQAPVPSSAQAVLPGTRFVGRQPILDRRQRTFGYELLFRSGLENWASMNDESASLQVLDHMLVLGLDTVAPGGKAFVNCERQSLIDRPITLLPAESTVVEVLETVVVDDVVIAAVKAIKDLGYQIALDDFLPGQGADRLIELADYIKLDFRASSPERLRQMQLLLKRKGLSLLAEKVETEEEFELARAQGYSYFQGYFFARPTILQGRAIPSNQMLYLQLLSVISESPLNSHEIERLVMAEASLCFRVLRMVNSAGFGIRSHVTSIRQALVLLGEDQIRKLVTVAATTSLGQDAGSSPELILLALHRARFCELLAQGAHQIRGEQYLIGLLSPVDAILHVPMEHILKMLPLRSDAACALLGDDGPVAAPLRIFQSFERADGPRCANLCAKSEVSENEVTTKFVESLQWATRELGRANF